MKLLLLKSISLSNVLKNACFYDILALKELMKGVIVMAMSKYAEKIHDNSVWVTATPTPVTSALPFYAVEAGHFFAMSDYTVSREFHDSYLLLYCISGSGTVKTENAEIALSAEAAAVIDCRGPHSYYSTSENWEFLWLHFNGSAAAAMTNILYPAEPRAVIIEQPQSFAGRFMRLMEQIKLTDVISGIEASTNIQRLYNELIRSALENEKACRKKEYTAEIEAAIEFIHENYSDNITVDDMLEKIHLSKYHFIRIFRRVMGTTPYSYLTTYRINTAKHLLRTTDMTVAEIAAGCGFMDTSNFIIHFKKHTGVKPVQYRRDFAQ